MDAGNKKLNEMNRLADMAHFPPLVNAGATVNILATLCVTWWLVPRHPQVYAPMVWVAVVLCLNLLPVVLLRLTLRPETVYRPLAQMDFFQDQHKFSDWVYLAASANMAFWVLGAWAVFSIRHTGAVLFGVLIVASVATFSPVLVRTGRRSLKRSDVFGLCIAPGKGKEGIVRCCRCIQEEQFRTGTLHGLRQERLEPPMPGQSCWELAPSI